MRKMNRPILWTALVVLTAGAALSARPQKPEARMAEAAAAFLRTLDPTAWKAALSPLESEERLTWCFSPSEMLPAKVRRGVPLKQMSSVQRKAAGELLAAGLSQKGYDKATMIRALET